VGFTEAVINCTPFLERFAWIGVSKPSPTRWGAWSLLINKPEIIVVDSSAMETVVLPKDGTSRAFSKAEYRLSKGELIQRRGDKKNPGVYLHDETWEAVGSKYEALRGAIMKLLHSHISFPIFTR